eukprot:403351335
MVETIKEWKKPDFPIDIIKKISQKHDCQAYYLTHNDNAQKVKYHKVNFRDKDYFVKKMVSSKINTDKLDDYIKIQKKFGVQMIARILRCRIDGEHLYLIYKFADYEDLLIFSNTQEIDERKMQEIMRQIFTFQTVLHLSGYSHNDLKAQNILVYKCKSNIQKIKLRLIDFETSEIQKVCVQSLITPDYLLNKDIGYEQIFLRAEKDVIVIKACIQEIAKNQRDKKLQEIKEKSKSIIEEEKQKFINNEQEEEKSSYQGDSDKKNQQKKKFTGGLKSAAEKNVQKIKNFYSLEFNELVRLDQNKCAFQILFSDYLRQNEAYETYAQKIVNNHMCLQIVKDNISISLECFKQLRVNNLANTKPSIKPKPNNIMHGGGR